MGFSFSLTTSTVDFLLLGIFRCGFIAALLAGLTCVCSLHAILWHKVYLVVLLAIGLLYPCARMILSMVAVSGSVQSWLSESTPMWVAFSEALLAAGLEIGLAYCLFVSAFTSQYMA